MFSTREIATLIWGGIILLWLLPKKDIRDSIGAVVIAFFKLFSHLIILFTLSYVVIIFIFIYIFGLLETDLIKDYIIWICFALCPLIWKVTTINNFDILNLIRESFKFSIIPIFLINEYTLALWAELIILPATVLITLLIVFIENDPSVKILKKPLNIILSIIGGVIFFMALRGFILNIDDISKYTFWEKLFLNIVGILLHLPLLVCLKRLIIYDQIINRTAIKTKRKKIIAFMIIFIHLSLKIEKLNSLRKKNLRDISTYSQLANVTKAEK
ncbi:hypothetical protein M1D70_12895 [Paenibacillus sp. AK002]